MHHTPTSKNDRKKRRAYKKFVDFLKQSTHNTNRKKNPALNKKGKGQFMISKQVRSFSYSIYPGMQVSQYVALIVHVAQGV